MSDKPNILLVDDDPDLLEALVEMIGSAEAFITHQAGDGREALEMVQKLELDAILSDLLMPELNGAEFLAKLREWNCDVPFILLTGGGSRSVLQRVLRLGAFDYLEKPVNPSLLIQTLDAAARSRHAVKPVSITLPPFPSPQESPFDAEKLAAFLQQAGDQLTFCQSSVQEIEASGLGDSALEIAFMIRVVRSIAHQAYECRLFDLSDLCFYLAENLIVLRTSEGGIANRLWPPVRDGLEALIAAIKALDSGESSAQALHLARQRLHPATSEPKRKSA